VRLPGSIVIIPPNFIRESECASVVTSTKCAVKSTAIPDGNGSQHFLVQPDFHLGALAFRRENDDWGDPQSAGFPPPYSHSSLQPSWWGEKTGPR